MWLAIIAVIITFALFPRETISTGKSFLLISSLTLASFVINIRSKINIMRRLLNDYRKGDIDLLQFFRELITFKIRRAVLSKLGCGCARKSGKDSFEVVYYDGDRRYCVRFPKNRTVRQIQQVKDTLQNDVTSDFFEFLGSNHNFHSIQTTPKLLGWEYGLHVHYRNGTDIFYQSDDIIKPYISN